MLCFNVALLYFFVLFNPATAVQITNTEYNGIQTGSPFNVTWTDAAGPVTILLRMGNTTDPSKAEAKAIWVDLTGTYFTWVPNGILQTGLYRFQLDDAAVNPVYSPLFELTFIPGIYTTTTTSSISTTSSQTSAPTSQSANTTPTTSSPSAATTTSTVSTAQTGTTTKVKPKTAVKIGVIIAFIIFICLATYFVVSLIRNRAARKKRLSQATTTPTINGDGIVPKDTDLEHGHGPGAEMSGALDSAISISNGVSSPTVSTIRGGSTRPTTGSDPGMEGVAEEMEMEPVEIGSSEQGPIEIGSSGYGKEMSAQEKGKAVEMEANQRIRFEERKGRRRGVRLMVGRRKILF